MKESTVSIIIPTWNNPEYLRPAVTSILRNSTQPGLFEIIVINNGDPTSCDYLKGVKNVKVINAGKNLGWEGGIDLGMKNSSSPFVCFFNDDAYVPQGSRMWLNNLLQHFRNPQVAAVGPTSNVVMGTQNIFYDIPYTVFRSRFLIGFCVLMRRSAFDQIGGMDMTLPGGDDLDWSIRLNQAGYSLMIDRGVFVYHHGFKTGTRLYGEAQRLNGWNSFEQWDKTNQAIIKKHGLKLWWKTLSDQILSGDNGKFIEDIEGKVIRKLISKSDKKILDIGCGPSKTLSRAVGVDFIPKGQLIPTLDGSVPKVSEGDVVADVSESLPVQAASQDVIIARHILEHMIDHVGVLAMWIKKIKPGGKLILALPNEEWHRTIPMNIEHVHAFTTGSVTTLLNGLGLKNIGFYTSGNTVSFIVEATI